MISLTERAAQEIKKIQESQGSLDSMLRVFVTGGGCSGLQYGMALDDEAPEEGDQIFQSNGVTIVVDERSYPFLVGSEVDYIPDLLGGGFKINNPNAVRSCGCGHSFQTEDSEGATGSCCGC